MNQLRRVGVLRAIGLALLWPVGVVVSAGIAAAIVVVREIKGASIAAVGVDVSNWPLLVTILVGPPAAFLATWGFAKLRRDDAT